MQPDVCVTPGLCIVGNDNRLISEERVRGDVTTLARQHRARPGGHADRHEKVRVSMDQPAATEGTAEGSEHLDRIRQLEAKLRQTRSEVEHLSLALTAAREIGAAVGIVMERRKLTHDDAFAVLVRSSQTTQMKVREVAFHLVETGALPLHGPQRRHSPSP